MGMLHVPALRLGAPREPQVEEPRVHANHKALIEPRIAIHQPCDVCAGAATKDTHLKEEAGLDCIDEVAEHGLVQRAPLRRWVADNLEKFEELRQSWVSPHVAAMQGLHHSRVRWRWPLILPPIWWHVQRVAQVDSAAVAATIVGCGGMQIGSSRRQ